MTTATATKTTKMGMGGGGGACVGGEGELATTSLGILNSTSSSPVALPRLNCQISTNQR